MEEVSGFYALRKHRSSQHGILIRTSNLYMDNLPEDIDDEKLKEEPIFFLVDSELEKRKHCEFNLAMSSFSNSFVNENLHHVFN